MTDDCVKVGALVCRGWSHPRTTRARTRKPSPTHARNPVSNPLGRADPWAVASLRNEVAMNFTVSALLPIP